MHDRYQWLGTLDRPSLWRLVPSAVPVHVGHITRDGDGWRVVTAEHGAGDLHATLESAASALCAAVGAPDVPSGLAEVGGGDWVDEWLT